MTAVDHLAEAKAAAARGDATEALMHGQIASVERLDDLVKIATAAFGEWKDAQVIDVEIVYEPENLADILRESDEVYPLGTYEGRWNFIARCALEWLNLTPPSGDKK